MTNAAATVHTCTLIHKLFCQSYSMKWSQWEDSHIYNLEGVGNCLGIFFFSLGNFFWISGSHHFPCYLQHFGAGNCHFHGMCNGFEFEPLIFHCIFHGICNSLQHVLSIFHALCSIFELESAFPPYVQHFTATFLTVLAGFWS